MLMVRSPPLARSFALAQTHRAHIHAQITGNLRIGGSLGCRQDDTRSQYHLLLTAMAPGDLE
jgi:hypothetical protein